MGIVGDAREPASQLDHGRQLAVLVESGADRGGIFLGDDEHLRHMGRPPRCQQALHGSRLHNDGRWIFASETVPAHDPPGAALVARLHDTRASLAAIAAGVRTFSALEDARTHSMVKAARERRSGVAESTTCDPELTAFQGIATTNIDGAVVQSKKTAEVLDRVTEALERLAASLRDT